MPEVTRNGLLHSLEQDWGTYVERYRRLSEDGRRRFLRNQGYARLADLPAHFIAWWEEGVEALERMPADPAYRSPDHAVDEFNAQAAARFAAAGEREVADVFEGLRRDLVRVVSGLPESAFREPRIADRLQIEILGRMEEHKMRAE